MSISAEARLRLETRMEEQRSKIGKRWRQVAEDAGVTYEAIRGARKGPTQIPAFTRRAIERGLEWPENEIDRILDESSRPSAEPTDAEIVAMSVRQVAEFAVRRGRERGKAAQTKWFQHARRVRDEALRTLVAEQD